MAKIIPEEIDRLLEALNSHQAVLIDVREAEEWHACHLECSLLWPLSNVLKLSEQELKERLLSYKEPLLYFHCRSGQRAHRAIDYIKTIESRVQLGNPQLGNRLSGKETDSTRAMIALSYSPEQLKTFGIA